MCVRVGVDRYSGRLCMHCPCAPGRSCAAVFNLLQGPMFVCLAIVAFASRSSLSSLRLSIRIVRLRFAPPSTVLLLSSVPGSCVRVSLWPRALSSPRASVASSRVAGTRRSSAARLFSCALLVCAPSAPSRALSVSSISLSALGVFPAAVRGVAPSPSLAASLGALRFARPRVPVV